MSKMLIALGNESERVIVTRVSFSDGVEHELRMPVGFGEPPESYMAAGIEFVEYMRVRQAGGAPAVPEEK